MKEATNDILGSQFFDFDLFPVSEEFEGKITGENARKILLVVHPSPTEADSGFLAKVLSAVNVDAKRDILLATAENKQTFSLFDLVRKHSIEVVLIFGLAPSDCGLNLNMRPYRPITHKGVLFLLCNQLEEIAANQQLKKHLWSALQQIFLQNDA